MCWFCPRDVGKPWPCLSEQYPGSRTHSPDLGNPQTDRFLCGWPLGNQRWLHGGQFSENAGPCPSLRLGLPATLRIISSPQITAARDPPLRQALARALQATDSLKYHSNPTGKCQGPHSREGTEAQSSSQLTCEEARVLKAGMGTPEPALPGEVREPPSQPCTATRAPRLLRAAPRGDAR